MIKLYLDIETYRKEPFRDEKVIAIGVSEGEGRIEKFLEWDLGDEKGVIKEFYSYIFDLMEEEDFLVVVGFGILRFDIPLLIQKGVEYGYSLSELNAFWHRTFTIDLFQSMLPAYNFRYKGNSLENLVKEAERFGVSIELYGSGREVRNWYENGEYQKIERHLEADLEAIRQIDLNGIVIKILKEKLLSVKQV